MSLTKDALEHIQQNQSVLVEQVQKAFDEKADFPAAVLPSNLSIKDVEPYLEAPSRFRGIFSTDSISEFARYCKDFSAQKCFVSSDKLFARAHFDLGAPGEPEHNTHKAELELDFDQTWQLMTTVDRQRHSQRNIAEFLEDHQNNLVAVGVDSETPLSMTAAVAAIRKITIERVRNVSNEARQLGHTQSEFERIDAKSDDLMPGYFTFKGQPHMELSEREILFRLAFHMVGDNSFQLSLNAVKLPQLLEEIQIEFKEKLVEVLPEETGTYIGRFQTARN